VSAGEASLVYSARAASDARLDGLQIVETIPSWLFGGKAGPIHYPGLGFVLVPSMDKARVSPTAITG
jgi:hypothetical protein